MPVAVFCLFFTSQKSNIKRSPNATKLFADFLCPEDAQEAQNVHQRGPVGPTRHQGAPEAPSTPWLVVGPMVTFSTASQLYKYSNIPETLGESTKNCFSHHEIQSRALFRHSAGGEHDREGVHHPRWCSSMMR